MNPAMLQLLAARAASSSRGVAYIPLQGAATNATSHTWSMNTGAPGEGRNLLIGVSCDYAATRTVTAVTVDGASASLDASSPLGWHPSALARIALPVDASTVTVVTSYSAGVTAAVCGWVVTGGPLSVAGSNANFLAAPGVRTLDAAVGGLAFNATFTPDSGSTMTWSGGLALAEQTLAATPRRRHVLYGICGSTTLTLTPSISTTNVGAAVAYNP